MQTEIGYSSVRQTDMTHSVPKRACLRSLQEIFYDSLCKSWSFGRFPANESKLTFYQSKFTFYIPFKTPAQDRRDEIQNSECKNCYRGLNHRKSLCVNAMCRGFLF